MTHRETSAVAIPPTTPQSLHREAAAQLDRAAKHHRQAALLHDAGDARQADTHANIAHASTARALADSEMALKVNRWRPDYENSDSPGMAEAAVSIVLV
jgi:hypothetical protein